MNWIYSIIFIANLYTFQKIVYELLSLVGQKEKYKKKS